MNAQAVVRRATPADLAAILCVEHACSEAPHWSSERYLHAIAAGEGTFQQRAILLAVVESQIAGFVVVAVAAGEAELESVAVLPQHRRGGLGRMLCEAATAWAASQAAEEMWLEVRVSSAGAQALYRQLGFEITGTRRNYYADPVDDAVLMKAKLRKAGHL